MSTKGIVGEVVAILYEVKFAYSGKVVSVRRSQGNTINKGESIASLDRKTLQMELDRQLADYEKTRADFELFRIKMGDGGDDVAKYLRQAQQANLNRSVKEVEIAKYKFDQADLISPVTGTIIDMGGLVVGLNVTPASNPVKVIDEKSIKFSFSAKQLDIKEFKEKKVKVTIFGEEEPRTGVTVYPVFGKDGEFTIDVTFEDITGLIPGMKGELTI